MVKHCVINHNSIFAAAVWLYHYMRATLHKWYNKWPSILTPHTIVICGQKNQLPTRIIVRNYSMPFLVICDMFKYINVCQSITYLTIVSKYIESNWKHTLAVKPKRHSSHTRSHFVLSIVLTCWKRVLVE